MVRAELVLKMGVIGSLALVCGFGCGGSPKVPHADPSAVNLREIVWAYGKATASLEHPPRTKEELAPYFIREPDPEDPDRPVKEINVAEVFRSPTDGQDYVINWGSDLRDNEGNPKTWPVFAYEKVGQDGKRLVLQGRYVKTVTDEQLADLPFPPGFKKP